MDKLEAATVRAEQAKQLLENPLFDKAFQDARAAFLNALGDLDNLKAEHATELHARVKALDAVRRVLEKHIETGKIAQKELEGRKLSWLRRA